jgi:hypothetical protein
METEIVVRPEPGGDGYQALLERVPGYWERGKTKAEALGALVLRAFDEIEGFRITGIIMEPDRFPRR